MIEKVVMETTVSNSNHSSDRMTCLFGLHQYIIFKIFLSRYQAGGRSVVGRRETVHSIMSRNDSFPKC